MHHSLRSFLLATAAAAVMCAPAAAQTASRVITFGDSLSDNGNLSAVTGGARPGPAYFEGRFSNGPVFTELLAGGPNSMQRAGFATLTGRPVDPNDDQNYAFGGARTDRLLTAGAATPPGIPAQIDFFQLQGQSFRAGDVVTLYGGANNIFQAFQQVALGANPAIIGPASVGAARDVAASAS